MPSQLYQRFVRSQPTNPVMQAVQKASQVAHGDPQAAFNQMMQTNPQFAQFVSDNRGKTPEQIASEHGVDLSQVMRMIGGGR